ncbi:cytochrome P450 [Streptomyces olivochromogenes]|uniref:cytochrome P450 n=1 Tax=Streptomyces olivochromogenes TaxID=1963 RepID=UPI0036DC87C7
MAISTAASFVLVAAFVPESPVREAGIRMYWVGGLLLGGGITAIVYAVSEGSQWGWGSSRFADYTAGALITLVAFVLVERRVADPLFPPSMTRRRPVWTVLLATSIAAGSLSAVGVVMQMLVLMPKIPTIEATPEYQSVVRARTWDGSTPWVVTRHAALREILADLNTALSLPLPSLMICGLLGVPYEDHEFFQEHAGVTNARFKTPQEAAETTRELRRYISGLIEAKMDDPTEDVLSDLGARVKEGDLSLAEAAPLGHILLVAGHDTSANMITLGTALLLQNPDQLAALRENCDDPKFVANAVEELLRYLTIPHLLARRAVVEDIEIDGETIRAGEGVIAAPPGADPAARGRRLGAEVQGGLGGVRHLRAARHLVLLEVRKGADTTRPSSHRREDGLRPAVKLVGTTGFEPATP